MKLANAFNTPLLLCHWGSVDAPDFAPFNGNPEKLKKHIVNPERIHVLAPRQPFVLSKLNKKVTTMQFDINRILYVLTAILTGMLFTSETLYAQHKEQLVRLAVIEVDTGQLGKYNEFITEEIEASITLEPGVITLYGVAEKENPERVTLFETYGDSSMYKSHLATSHFQKYKQGTLEMVKHLELIEMQPLLYVRKPQLSPGLNQNYFIRLIKMEIDSSSIERYSELAKRVMLPGVKKEPGVLVMYAVAQKNRPTHISILEVYADEKAYKKHLNTQHFLRYKEESANMVKSLKLIEVKPIFLGSKPQRN